MLSFALDLLDFRCDWVKLPPTLYLRICANSVPAFFAGRYSIVANLNHQRASEPELAAILEDPELGSVGFAILELELASAPPEVEFVVLFPEYGLALAENGEKALAGSVFRAPLIDFAKGRARYSVGPVICYFIDDFDLVEIAAPDKGFSTGEFGWPRIGLGDWRPGRPALTREEALQAYLARHGKKPSPRKSTLKEVAAAVPAQKPKPAPPPPAPKVAEVPKGPPAEVKAKNKDAPPTSYGRMALAATVVVAIVGGAAWFFRQELGLVPLGSMSVDGSTDTAPPIASNTPATDIAAVEPKSAPQAAQVTQACDVSKLLFADEFEVAKPHWVTAVANNEISPELQNGRMIVNLPSDDSVWLINEDTRYGDADICVKVVSLDDSAGANVGVAFWYSDLGEAYYFVVFPSTQRAVVFKGSDTNYEAFESGAIKSAAGAVNELRVMTKGNEATMFINGVEVQKRTGEPPREGQLVGMVASSPKNRSATFAFEDFRVAQP